MLFQDLTCSLFQISDDLFKVSWTLLKSIISQNSLEFCKSTNLSSIDYHKLIHCQLFYHQLIHHNYHKIYQQLAPINSSDSIFSFVISVPCHNPKKESKVVAKMVATRCHKPFLTWWIFIGRDQLVPWSKNLNWDHTGPGYRCRPNSFQHIKIIWDLGFGTI